MHWKHSMSKSPLRGRGMQQAPYKMASGSGDVYETKPSAASAMLADVEIPQHIWTRAKKEC